MIKLKNILPESTNVELHKVITDKTEPTFMTEEQWSKKWSDDSVNEEKQPLNESFYEMIIGYMIAALAHHLFKMIKKAVSNGTLKKDSLKKAGQKIQRVGKNVENIKIKDPYIFGKGITPSYLKQQLKK